MPRGEHRKGNGFVYKPSSGQGQGDGWGGPAKGASKRGKDAPPAPPFDPETSAQANAKRWRDKEAGITSRAEIRAHRTVELEDMLYDIASTSERDETRVTAATKLHAIYNGTPIARSINLNTDDVSNLSDDEIRAELARTGGTPSEAGAGAKAPRVPAKSSGILH
jgi:hypothetical protein